jgi:hypothetical protein
LSATVIAAQLRSDLDPVSAAITFLHPIALANAYPTGRPMALAIVRACHQDVARADWMMAAGRFRIRGMFDRAWKTGKTQRTG